MSFRDRSRNTEARTEGIVCLLVMMLLFPLLLLTYFAKNSVPPPANAVYINDSDVTAETLTGALGIDKTIAQRLMAERARRNGFESVGQILALRQRSGEETKDNAERGMMNDESRFSFITHHSSLIIVFSLNPQPSTLN